jgi:quercetin dioxygenase-like cupin family protein
MIYKKDTGKPRQLMEGVQLNTLVHGAKTLMAQFHLTQGAQIPLHAHEHEQTGMLLSGKVRFKIDDEIVVFEPGDAWCIAGDVPHAADALEDSVVLEIFTPVRQEYLPRD